LLAIEEGADLVANVTPYDQGYGPVKYGRETLFVSLSGVGEAFLKVQGLELARGRFFNAFEAWTGKNVCVLGWDLHEKLFGKVDGVGKTIRVQGEKFRVLGVMAEKDERSFVRTGITDNMRLYLPIRTLQRRSNLRGYPLIMDNPLEAHLTRAAVSQLKGILALLHGPKNNFLVQSMEEIVTRELERLRIFSVFLGGLGGISLLVGGIGIMNIMLVSVKERTKEIGLRKAVGAKERDILLQFLVEAVLLCFLGGILGLGLGALAALAIRGATMVPAAVTLDSVLMGLGSALVIGLFFGVYPAWKASRLDPITCLRNE
ncbi:MAG: ABC transporter permease, partial [Firmicutes bacterium]|nr:ABC transporter permease [Bacillota bacterium]